MQGANAAMAYGIVPAALNTYSSPASRSFRACAECPPTCPPLFYNCAPPNRRCKTATRSSTVMRFLEPEREQLAEIEQPSDRSTLEPDPWRTSIGQRFHPTPTHACSTCSSL